MSNARDDAADAGETDVLRLSGVSFLNAQPVLHGLLSGAGDARTRLTLAEPSELSRMLFEDEVDAALAPVAPLATHGDLEIVPNIALGCRGPVRSVLLVGERPIETLDEILLDASSRTSVVLARLVLRHLRGDSEPRYCARPASEIVDTVGGGVGGLLIGDVALELESRFSHRIDLGQAWMEMTGLPFVFAVWVARPGRLTQQDAASLSASLQAGLAELGPIARAWARGHGGDPEDYLRYLSKSMRYDLGADAITGLREFLRRAAEAGLLPCATLRFLSGVRSRPARGSSAAGSPAYGLDRGSSGSGKSVGSGRSLVTTLDTLLARGATGERLSLSEALRLHEQAPLSALGRAADARRRALHSEGAVTYAIDRHIAYTNVCTARCTFCDFARSDRDPEAFALSREMIGERVEETLAAGGSRVLLQGGQNPRLPLEWFEGVFQWLKRRFDIELHALSPEEVLHLVRVEDLSVQAVIERLAATGLDAIAGTGAEVLTDRVRRRLCPDKCSSAAWLDVMRISHRLGMRGSATMMHGTYDSPRDRLLHLIKLRDLQDETAGFLGFSPFRFEPARDRLLASGVAAGVDSVGDLSDDLPGDRGDDSHLRLLALSRLVLDNFAHIQAVATGPAADVLERALRFGADQLVSRPFEHGADRALIFAADPAWAATTESRVGLRLVHTPARARG
ncbi:MAG: radical SAM protein [Myxococcales bacterium]|nr:radical SAM protein [Myxococcales bacterium]